MFQSTIHDLSGEEAKAVLSRMVRDHPILAGPYLGVSANDPMTRGDEPTEGQQPDFCFCGRCVLLAPESKQICCQRSHGPCITLDPTFTDLCLRPNVLEVCGILNYGSQFGRTKVSYEPSAFRNSADRFYTLWQQGILGSGVRIQMPNCALARIRRQYPAPDGQYTGFQPARR